MENLSAAERTQIDIKTKPSDLKKNLLFIIWKSNFNLWVKMLWRGLNLGVKQKVIHLLAIERNPGTRSGQMADLWPAWGFLGGPRDFGSWGVLHSANEIMGQNYGKFSRRIQF